MINSHWFSQIGFWYMIAFFVVKIFVSCFTFAVWRKDFRRIQGHVDCCKPAYPACQLSGAGAAEPMIDSDPERGMRR